MRWTCGPIKTVIYNQRYLTCSFKRTALQSQELQKDEPVAPSCGDTHENSLIIDQVWADLKSVI